MAGRTNGRAPGSRSHGMVKSTTTSNLGNFPVAGADGHRVAVFGRQAGALQGAGDGVAHVGHARRCKVWRRRSTFGSMAPIMPYAWPD